MTCAARLKLNSPSTSAKTPAKTTRLRIYRPKPANAALAGARRSHPAQDQELFMAARTKTGRELPQFGRASVRVTHYWSADSFFSKLISVFQQIELRQSSARRKHLPHSHQSYSF
jgi:hypothetical protein